MQSGTVLQSRYAVQSKLGTGAQATVWRCIDTISDAAVAVKHASDPAEWRNARREYVLLRLLNLPGVVPILDEWVDETGWYVVMPVLQGGAFPDDAEWPRVRALMRSALSTLAAMHARGVVHADLKPDNMIVQDERVTFIDLGFAADNRAVADLSGFTLDYAAPERWFGRPATGAVDVFALARVAVAALGAAPQAHADMKASHQALLDAVITLPIPDEAHELLVQMLAWDASERPTATQAAAALGESTDRQLTIGSRHRFDHTAEDMQALLAASSVSLAWLLDAGVGQVEGDVVFFTREEVSRLELATAPRSDEPGAPPLRAVDAGDVDAVLAWCEDSVARPERLRWSLPLARWCVGYTQTTRPERHLQALALFTSLAVHSEQAAAMHDAALTVDRAAVCAVGEQCAQVLRAAIAVRTQGRLEAESVTRVVESAPLHPTLEPAMTLVKVWQMRSDMDGLRAWLDAELEREEDPKKVGRLLTWLSIVAYKQQDYELGLAAIERKRQMGCEVTLSDLANQSGLLLEVGRYDEAVIFARELGRLARIARYMDLGVQAVVVQRGCEYRSGVTRSPRLALARDSMLASPAKGAVVCMNEAAVALRYDALAAEELARWAEDFFEETRRQSWARLCRAIRAAATSHVHLARGVVEETPVGDIGSVVVQTLGLCRMVGVEVPSLENRTVSARATWDRCREVLSIHEAIRGRWGPLRRSAESTWGLRAVTRSESIQPEVRVFTFEALDGQWGIRDCNDQPLGTLRIVKKGNYAIELFELNVSFSKLSMPDGVIIHDRSGPPDPSVLERWEQLASNSAGSGLKWWALVHDELLVGPPANQLPSVQGILRKVLQEENGNWVQVGWSFHEVEKDRKYGVHHFLGTEFKPEADFRYDPATMVQDLKTIAQSGKWYASGGPYYRAAVHWHEHKQ